MIVAMSRPGPAIRLTKNPTNGWYANFETQFIIPMDKSLTLTATQELQKPIQKLFEYIQDAVIGAAGDLAGATGSTIARAGLEIANLSGFQLGTKGYYAQAWKGSLPSSFSLTAKFYRGMMGVWNAKTEVFDPARQMAGLTVPYELIGGAVLQGPVPSPGIVFTTFTTNLIADAISAIAGTASTPSATTNISSSQAVASSGSIQTAQSNLLTTVTNTLKKFGTSDTWQVEFGYFDGSSTMTSFWVLQRYIVETSSIQWGMELEKNSDGYFYPTSSEVTLTFDSEDVLTSANFVPAASQTALH